MFYFCLGETSLIDIFKNQISSLVVNITKNEKRRSTKDLIKRVFTQIFNMFTNLEYLNLNSSSVYFEQLSFDMSPPTVISSTLLELHVSLMHFTDCLYLLDGRFNKLRTLRIHICDIISSSQLSMCNKVSYFIYSNELILSSFSRINYLT
jgi:hypothetical protein